jgi:hypothetical protein
VNYKFFLHWKGINFTFLLQHLVQFLVINQEDVIANDENNKAPLGENITINIIK